MNNCVNKLTFFWLLRDERFDLTGSAVLLRWLRDERFDLTGAAALRWLPTDFLDFNAAAPSFLAFFGAFRLSLH
jgi:hypothetical protein